MTEQDIVGGPVGRCGRPTIGPDGVLSTVRNEFFNGADVQAQVSRRRGVTADDLRLLEEMRPRSNCPTPANAFQRQFIFRR